MGLDSPGCPGPTRFFDAFKFFSSKIFSIRLAKFLTTVFSRLPKCYNSSSFFSHLPKFVTFLRKFSNFTKIRSLDAPTVLHHAPVTTFSLPFFSHLPTFYTKTGPLDAPQGGCPGPSYLSHPLLHATKLGQFS